MGWFETDAERKSRELQEAHNAGQEHSKSVIDSLFAPIPHVDHLVDGSAIMNSLAPKEHHEHQEALRESYKKGLDNG